VQVHTQLPTSPPADLAVDAVFFNPGGDLLVKLITSGAVNLRVARYLGNDWVWHPVGTLTWDSAVADSDATAASKTAGKRFERVICDDQRGYYALVKVAGAGTITKAEMFAARIGRG